MILILLEKVKFFRNKFYTQCNSMVGVVTTNTANEVSII